jgi:hypothetical protein
MNSGTEKVCFASYAKNFQLRNSGEDRVEADGKDSVNFIILLHSKSRCNQALPLHSI